MMLSAALCAVLGTLAPGKYDRTMGDRTYQVLVPDSACAKPGGLVVAIHGWTQTKEWACSTIVEPYAADFCIVGVCPQGISAESPGYSTGWNTNDEAGFYAAYDRDDVGFVRSIVNELVPEFSIPSDKVYAFGFSFGGGLTFRIACETADLFSGYAVSGMIWDNTASGKGMRYHDECSVALPLWRGSGTRDEFYEQSPPYDRMHADWKMYSEEVLGCDPGSRALSYETDDVRCEEYTDCPGVVSAGTKLTEHCSYEGMVHAWPGEEPWCLDTPTNPHACTDVPATPRALIALGLPSTTGGSDDDSDDGGNGGGGGGSVNVGVIAGAAVGGAFGLGLVAAAAYCMLKRRGASPTEVQKATTPEV